MFHQGAWPGSALLLMKARYSAYAVGDANFVWRTWHPRTRPADVTLDPALKWTSLEIKGYGEDWVDFVASYVSGGGVGRLTEHSRFERRAGKWMYVDGDVS